MKQLNYIANDIRIGVMFKQKFYYSDCVNVVASSLGNTTTKYKLIIKRKRKISAASGLLELN